MNRQKADELYALFGYELNRNFQNKKKQPGVVNTSGIKNARDPHAYVCYLSSTFQMLCSNHSFVRDVLDFLTSHQIILTKRIMSNESISCYHEELDHMISHPVLSLFLIIMFKTKVISFKHCTNIKELFFQFADNVVDYVTGMEDKETIYPTETFNQVQKIGDYEKTTKRFDYFMDELSYYIPAILGIIKKDESISNDTFFEQTTFGVAEEIANFTEYILLHMEKEFEQHIPVKDINSLVNPVNCHYRLKLKLSKVCTECSSENDMSDIDNVYCFPIVAKSNNENEELDVKDHIEITENELSTYSTPNPRLAKIFTEDVFAKSNCPGNSCSKKNLKLKIAIVHCSKSLIVNTLRVNSKDVYDSVKINLCLKPLDLQLIRQLPHLQQNNNNENSMQISSIIMYHPPKPPTTNSINEQETTENSNVGHFTGLYRRRRTKYLYGFSHIDDETVENIPCDELNKFSTKNLSNKNISNFENGRQNSCIVCYSKIASTNIYRKVIYPEEIICCILRSSTIDILCDTSFVVEKEDSEKKTNYWSIDEDCNNSYSKVSFNLNDNKISYVEEKTTQIKSTTFNNISIMEIDDSYFCAIVVHIPKNVERETESQTESKFPSFIENLILPMNGDRYIVFFITSLNLPNDCENLKYKAYENDLLSVVQEAKKKGNSEESSFLDNVCDHFLEEMKCSTKFNIQDGKSLSGDSNDIVAKGLKRYDNQKTNTYEFNPSSEDGVGAFLQTDEKFVTSKVFDFYVKRICSNWNVGAMGIYADEKSQRTFAVINNFTASSISDQYLEFLMKERPTYIFCIKATGSADSVEESGHYYLYFLHFEKKSQLVTYRVDGFFEQTEIECDILIGDIITKIKEKNADITVKQAETGKYIHYIKDKDQYMQQDGFSCGIYSMIYMTRLVKGNKFEYSFKVEKQEVSNERNKLKRLLGNEIESLTFVKALSLLNNPSTQQIQLTQSKETPDTADEKTTETQDTGNETTTTTTPTGDEKTTKTTPTGDEKTTQTPDTEDETTTKTPDTADKKTTETTPTADETTTETTPTADKKTTTTTPTADETTTTTTPTGDEKTTETTPTADKKTTTTTPTADETTTETTPTGDEKISETTPTGDETTTTETTPTADEKTTETTPTGDEKTTETTPTGDETTTKTPDTPLFLNDNDLNQSTKTPKTVTQTQNEDSQLSENVDNQDNEEDIFIKNYIKQLDENPKKVKYLKQMFQSPEIQLKFNSSEDKTIKSNTNKKTWQNLKSFFENTSIFRNKKQITEKYEYSKNWIVNDTKHSNPDNHTELWQNHILEMISECLIFTGELRIHKNITFSCIIFIDVNYKIENKQVGLIKYIQCHMKKSTSFKSSKTKSMNEKELIIKKGMVTILSYMFANISADENFMDIDTIKQLVLLLPKNNKDHHFIQDVTTGATNFEKELTLTPMKEESSNNYYIINKKECEYAVIQRSEFNKSNLYKKSEVNYNAMDPATIDRIEQDPETNIYYATNNVRSDRICLGDADATTAILDSSTSTNAREFVSNLQKKTKKIQSSKKINQQKKRASAKVPTGTLSCNGLKIASNNDELKAACSWLAMCKAMFYVDQTSGLFEKYQAEYIENNEKFQYLYLDSTMAGKSCIRQRISSDLRKHHIKWDNQKEKELSWILNTENLGVFILILEEEHTSDTTHCITLCRKENKNVRLYDPYNDLVHHGEQQVNEELFHHLCGTSTNRKCKGAKVVIQLSLIKKECNKNKGKKRRRKYDAILNKKKRKRNESSSRKRKFD